MWYRHDTLREDPKDYGKDMKQLLDKVPAMKKLEGLQDHGTHWKGYMKAELLTSLMEEYGLELGVVFRSKRDDMSKDKAYKTSSKVNKRGPIRRSKRLRGIESVEVHVRTPKRKRARK